MTVFAELTPPYSTIVADPPWSYARSTGIQGAIDDQYSTLSQEDIANLPVADLAAKDAHLYLWVTTPKLWDQPDPAEIARRWGFTYKTLITWVKGERVLPGGHRARPVLHQGLRTDTSGSPASNVLWQPRGAHSAKPAAFGDLVERCSPGPHLELFARAPRLGWDSWGKGYEIGAASRSTTRGGSSP